MLSRTSLIEPFSVQFDLAAGIMLNPQRTDRAPRFRYARYYADEKALEQLIAAHDDPIHYETLESPVPEEYGQVKFCISKLYPGLVGDEFFMTKGHYHAVVEAGETYLGLTGPGTHAHEDLGRRLSVGGVRSGETDIRASLLGTPVGQYRPRSRSFRCACTPVTPDTAMATSSRKGFPNACTSAVEIVVT